MLARSGVCDVLVAEAQFQVGDVAVEHAAHRRPARQPQREPLSDLRHRDEQLELAPELAVVAPLRLLEPLEVAVELRLRRERDPVDPLQHLAVLVAAPVRAGRTEELHGLDPPGGRQMRSPAHILEPVLAVDAHRVVGDPLQQLQLVTVARGGEEARGLGPGQLDALDRLVPLGQVPHAGLDPVEVFGRERPPDVEVVVEPVLDRRPDRELGLREQLPHRLRQQVGRAVPIDGLPGEVRERQPFDSRIALEPRREIPLDAVNLGREGVDRCAVTRHVRQRRAALVRLDRAVRKPYCRLRHRRPPWHAKIAPSVGTEAIRGSTHASPRDAAAGETHRRPAALRGTRHAVTGAPGRASARRSGGVFRRRPGGACSRGPASLPAVYRRTRLRHRRLAAAAVDTRRLYHAGPRPRDAP